MSQWYSLETYGVIRQQDTDAVQGLSTDEVVRRLIQHGSDELVERSRRSPWRIAWEQLTATMMIILIVAAAGLGLIAWGRLLHFSTSSRSTLIGYEQVICRYTGR
jgi:P-type Ca2+ transporter type 2C